MTRGELGGMTVPGVVALAAGAAGATGAACPTPHLGGPFFRKRSSSSASCGLGKIANDRAVVGRAGRRGQDCASGVARLWAKPGRDAPLPPHHPRDTCSLHPSPLSHRADGSRNEARDSEASLSSCLSWVFPLRDFPWGLCGSALARRHVFTAAQASEPPGCPRLEAHQWREDAATQW